MKIRCRKIILVLCKVCLVGILVFILNRLFMPKYISENQDGRISKEFYQEKVPLDIIFTGSSTVYNAVSTMTLWEEYGMTSFVRANASQTMWQSYYLLEDALNYQKPKLVVMDISFMKYADDFAEEPSNRKTIDGMCFSRSKLECIKASMYEGEQVIEYIFPIFRFHDRWNDLKKEDFQYMLKDAQVTYNGYLPSFEIRPADMQTKDKSGKDSYEFGNKSVYYLKKALELCQSKNIPVLLMKTPCYQSDWYIQYDENVAEIAANYDVDYINFENRTQTIELDFQRHTNDGGGHLNIVGAEKFSTYLGELIKEYYQLPDHRQEPVIAEQWSRKLLRYEEEKKEKMIIYDQNLKKLNL